MSISIPALGRSVAIAAITAGAVLIGASTAGAAPTVPDTTTVTTQQVTSTTDPVARTVTATLTSGRFVQDVTAHAIDITDAKGKAVETIPLTVRGKVVPVSAAVSKDGHALTLKQISFTDTGNLLINEWVWGVQHGGAVGAIIGCVLGFWFFVIPGCALGAAIGGTIGSPNGAQINGTFFRLITGT